MLSDAERKPKEYLLLYNELARQIVLGATAFTFAFFSLWAIVAPYSLASLLGYELKTPNSISEFHAIYAGVFAAQAMLAFYAFYKIEDAALGDVVAIFLLVQPLGRCIALLRKGVPSGVMRLLFALETLTGIVLLLIRPEL